MESSGEEKGEFSSGQEMPVLADNNIQSGPETSDQSSCSSTTHSGEIKLEESLRDDSSLYDIERIRELLDGLYDDDQEDSEETQEVIGEPYEEGPFCDVLTRNIVLQRDGFNLHKVRHFDDSDFGDRDGGHRGVDPEKTFAPKKNEDTSGQTAREIQRLLEQKGEEFRYTAEYYRAIEDEEQRMAEYKDLKISDYVPTGDEGEVRKNPFKYLGLEEGATFGQTRAAWIRLCRLWHQDLIDMDDPNTRLRLSRENQLESIIAELNKIEKYKPLSAEELEQKSPEEREEYVRLQKESLTREALRKCVKEQIIILATEKRAIINRAYEEAKKLFSAKDKETIDGYCWFPMYVDVSELSPRQHYADSLPLEGDGELRKYTYDNTGRIYIGFDYFDHWMEGSRRHQSIPLDELFGWMDLRQGKELSPYIIQFMQKEYKLTDDQSEQLRLMLMNREDKKFILKALDKNPRDSYNNPLKWFIDGVYNGPSYFHYVGFEESEHYPLGVEIKPNGELVFRYRGQDGGISNWPVGNKVVEFSKADVQMMEVVLFGPMLSNGSAGESQIIEEQSWSIEL